MEDEPIPRVTKGGTPTLLEAEFANQLIDKVNAGAGAGFGKVVAPLKKVEGADGIVSLEIHGYSQESVLMVERGVLKTKVILMADNATKDDAT